MMSQVIPFTSSNLPAHIAARAKNRSNTALTMHVGNGGFPVLSIKGKVFTLVKQDERKVITRELDGEQVPAAALEIVIVAANPNLSKVYYKGGYEDGANAKPDCFSNDGIKPDESVEAPQAKKCATCPKNIWGSGNNGKGKACGDSRRVAISAPDQINEPMLLRVPAASLKPLAEYGKKLDNRGASFDSVVTKIKFDMEEATPKLVFVPVGFLDAHQVELVDDVAKSDKVQQIIGLQSAPEHDTLPAPVVEEDDGFADFDKAAKVPAKKAVAEEAPAPKKKASVVDNDELEAAIAPAKKAAVVDEDEAPAPKKTVVKVTDDMDSELDSLLGALDD
jgi:hypothetical protein